MTSFDITKSIVAEIIVISNIILEELFEIATKKKFREIFETTIRVTKAERVVLKVIEVVVASKVIAETVTNFLKTRLTYPS